MQPPNNFDAAADKLVYVLAPRADLAKIASMSGVPGVKQSKLLKNALNGNKGAADMSIYGTRTPKGMKTIFSGALMMLAFERRRDAKTPRHA